MPDLAPYAIAVGGVLAMLMVWLGVQRAWGRIFSTGDDDVLEVRAGCGGCAHEGHCNLSPEGRPAALGTNTCAARDRGH